MANILGENDIRNVSWLQWLVVGQSLIMAAKGPAEEFLVSRTKQRQKDGGETKAFCEMGVMDRIVMLGQTNYVLHSNIFSLFVCEFCFSALQMPFYIVLTTFRVLTISIAIVTLQEKCLLIYPALIVTIIIIGYKKTSKGKDFMTRGLISPLTTGTLNYFSLKSPGSLVAVDYQFGAEMIFQVFWLSVNLVIIVVFGIYQTAKDHVTNTPHENTPIVFNASVLGACFGILSFALFHLSRKEEKEKVATHELTEEVTEVKLFEKALKDIGPCPCGQTNTSSSEFRRDYKGLFVLLDYPFVLVDLCRYCTYKVLPG